MSGEGFLPNVRAGDESGVSLRHPRFPGLSADQLAAEGLLACPSSPSAGEFLPPVPSPAEPAPAPITLEPAPFLDGGAEALQPEDEEPRCWGPHCAVLLLIVLAIVALAMAAGGGNG